MGMSKYNLGRRIEWTPSLIQYFGSGDPVSTGWTADDNNSYYVLGHGICTANICMTGPSNWGAVFQSGHEWRLNVPVAPTAPGGNMIIGRAVCSVYIDRGTQFILNFSTVTTYPQGDYPVMIHPIPVPGNSISLGASTLTGDNGPEYMHQFFGGYGSFRGIMQYEYTP